MGKASHRKKDRRLRQMVLDKYNNVSMSEALIDIIDAEFLRALSFEKQNKVTGLAAIAWNIGLLPAEEVGKLLKAVIEELYPGANATEAELADWFARLPRLLPYQDNGLNDMLNALNPFVMRRREFYPDDMRVVMKAWVIHDGHEPKVQALWEDADNTAMLDHLGEAKVLKIWGLAAGLTGLGACHAVISRSPLRKALSCLRFPAQYSPQSRAARRAALIANPRRGAI